MGGGQNKFWEFLFSKKILSYAYSSGINITQPKYKSNLSRFKYK